MAQEAGGPMTLRQLGRIVLAAGAFLGFGLGGALLSWVVLPLAGFGRDRVSRQRRRQRIVQASFVLFHDYMRLCGLVDFDPRRAPGLALDGPLVLVSNHPTLVDVTALIAAYGELCVVAKGSLFRNPLVGPLLALCGHIDGGGAQFGAGTQVVDEAVARLRAGHRVLMFPEGTRSPFDGLGRFHVGAFAAAFGSEVPIAPLAIDADPPGLKKGQAWWQIPARSIDLRVRPLAPLSPEEFESPRELMASVRERISAELDG